MREIKFRGKRVENGEWVYGGVAFYNGDKPHIISGLYPIEICEESLGQFTGLKDRNGNKVYEGDIVYCKTYDNLLWNLDYEDRDNFELFSEEELKGNCKDYFKSEVKFDEGSFYVTDGNTEMYLSAFYGDQRSSYPIHELEIIGNIHENEK